MAYIQLPIHVLGGPICKLLLFCTVQSFCTFQVFFFPFFFQNGDDDDEDLTQQMTRMTRIGKTMIATYLLEKDLRDQ